MTERNPYHPDGLWPTVGSYTRTDEEGDPRETVEFWKGAANVAKRRAETAEKERDEAKSWASRWQEEAEGNEAHGDALAAGLAAAVVRADTAEQKYEALKVAYNEQGDALVASYDHPRPLTADAIESVLHDILPLTANRLGEDDIASIASDLYLALTEPTRDPRAEEMQADLATAEEPEMDDEDRRLIADHLAALGYRKAES